MDSPRDEERLVMKLLEEGKTLQETAKAVHVSFSFISMVKNKMRGIDTEIAKGLLIPPQSLKLFSEVI